MIAIIDYGMGNLRSVQKAFERVGYEAMVTREAGADRVRSRRGLTRRWRFQRLHGKSWPVWSDRAHLRHCPRAESRFWVFAWDSNYCFQKVKNSADRKGSICLPAKSLAFILKTASRYRTWVGTVSRRKKTQLFWREFPAVNLSTLSTPSMSFRKTLR